MDKRPVPCEVTLSNGFKHLMPGEEYKSCIEKGLRLKMRPDDVVVASYPKSGTTWVQEIVWLICNEADTSTARSIKQTLRYGFLEFPDSIGTGIKYLMEWPNEKRRFIKTHMPFHLLPYELQDDAICKIIYVVRNPKDTCVSYYYFHRMNGTLPDHKSWREFQQKFSKGELSFGSWFDNVESYWRAYQKRDDSIYFVSYESLKKNPKQEVYKLSEFFKKDLSDAQIDRIVQHCTFESMRDNDSVNFSFANENGIMDFKVSEFLRKGEVGDWRNHFSQSENESFDYTMKKRTKDWSLKFEFDL